MSRHPSTILKFKIHGSQELLRGFLHMANNPDGTLASISLDTHREGTMGRALTHGVTALFNKGIEAGIPLKDFVDEFKDWKFEPSGPVSGSCYVTECKSLLDFVARELEATYLKPHEE